VDLSSISRRKILKYGAAAGSALFLPSKVEAARAEATAFAKPTLPGTAIPKYRLPLVIPPAMPLTRRLAAGEGRGADYYEIAVRQFAQRVLPANMPLTTVWSYGSANHPNSFHYPAFTIEANWQTAVRVKWINDLKDPVTGAYLPHILPVDPTVHWANPQGGGKERDTHPDFDAQPGRYMGPVPIVTHLHGGERTPQESDGFAEAWYLPAASNIPSSFSRSGTYYDLFKASSALGRDWEPGAAVFEYPNDQRAATLWYHDHTLGITRLNVYAGPAGFYLLRGGPSDQVGGVLPGPAPALGEGASGNYYEIPLAIQDRSFNQDGSLFYPNSREFFDDFAGPYIPASDISPIWNPEFFGDSMVVNGHTWPYLEVEQRRYRFRLLNGCNSRFLIIKFSKAIRFWQIGSDGGFLPAPVELEELLLGPAERADVIVDFTNVPIGSEIVLQNLGPDEPFGGGRPGADFVVANPETTGQVMQFRVVRATGVDTSTPPNRLKLPQFTALRPESTTRRVSLNEEDSKILKEVGPREAELGIINADGTAHALSWDDAITENPAIGATEVWEIHNFTEDAHPIHIHEVQFQIVDRQRFKGSPRPPERWEAGFKDTVIAYPSEITRVRATFHVPGLFAWHCHILEHEDNEMMRPYAIGPMPKVSTKT
jgi:FtsP/CotA-like multicopper oxidase with cupredoxin domain